MSEARRLIDAEMGLARRICDLVLTVSRSERDLNSGARGFPHVLTLGHSLDVDAGVAPVSRARGTAVRRRDGQTTGRPTWTRSSGLLARYCRLCNERLGRSVRLTMAGRDGPRRSASLRTTRRLTCSASLTTWRRCSTVPASSWRRRGWPGNPAQSPGRRGTRRAGRVHISPGSSAGMARRRRSARGGRRRGDCRAMLSASRRRGSVDEDSRGALARVRE